MHWRASDAPLGLLELVGQRVGVSAPAGQKDPAGHSPARFPGAPKKPATACARHAPRRDRILSGTRSGIKLRKGVGSRWLQE